MRSDAQTVSQYLDELPEDRRAMIAAVRDVILRNLPKGFRERMAWGVITYEVPLEKHPDTYNKKPLCYAALASQKNYCAVYLMSSVANDRILKDAFKKAGKKLDMGKSCVRFRKLDDLPLDAIGSIIASTTPDQFIAIMEAVRSQAGSRSSGGSRSTRGRSSGRGGGS